MADGYTPFQVPQGFGQDYLFNVKPKSYFDYVKEAEALAAAQLANERTTMVNAEAQRELSARDQLAQILAQTDGTVPSVQSKMPQIEQLYASMGDLAKLQALQNSSVQQSKQQAAEKDKAMKFAAEMGKLSPELGAELWRSRVGSDLPMPDFSRQGGEGELRSVGNGVARINPDGSYSWVIPQTEKQKEGKAPKYERYISRETGQEVTLDSNDPAQVKQALDDNFTKVGDEFDRQDILRAAARNAPKDAGAKATEDTGPGLLKRALESATGVLNSGPKPQPVPTPAPATKLPPPLPGESREAYRARIKGG